LTKIVKKIDGGAADKLQPHKDRNVFSCQTANKAKNNQILNNLKENKNCKASGLVWNNTLPF